MTPSRQGFGRRLPGALLDGLFLLLPLAFLTVFRAQFAWFSPFLVGAYFYLEVLTGTTPGKRVMGLLVLGEDGTPPPPEILKRRWLMRTGLVCASTFLAEVCRQLAFPSYVPETLICLALLPVLGALGMMGKGRQAAYDRMAGTAVFRVGPERLAGAGIKPLLGKLLDFLGTAPALLWRFLKTASGVYDRAGRFSVKGLLLLPYRIAKGRARAFLRGMLIGMLLHFLSVTLSGGYGDVDTFPVNLLVPTFNLVQGQTSSYILTPLFFMVATLFWSALAAMVVYAVRTARGVPARAAVRVPSWLPWITVVGAALVERDLWADDSGLNEMALDPGGILHGFMCSGGPKLAAQSATVGLGTGLGSAAGEALVDLGGGGGPPSGISSKKIQDRLQHLSELVGQGELLSMGTDRRGDWSALQGRLDALVAKYRATGTLSAAELAELEQAQARLAGTQDDATRKDQQAWADQEFQKLKEKMEKEAADERQQRLKEELERQKQERLKELRERQKDLERDSARGVTWKEIAYDFQNGVRRDVANLPGSLADLAVAGYDAATDPANWKALNRAASDAMLKAARDPLGTLASTATFLPRTLYHMGKEVLTDPLGVVKSALGGDQWRQAIDPNVPVGERVIRALLGTGQIGLTLATGATSRTGATALRGGMAAADEAAGLAQAGKAARTATKASVAADDAALAASRRAAWERAQAAGKGKVDDFAKALESGDANRIRRATLKVQGDKRALADINTRPDALKHGFNRHMGKVYEETDEAVKAEIAKRYGVSPEDVQIVKPTNPSTKVKVGADRDVTVRVRAKPGETVLNRYGRPVTADENSLLWKDVPHDDLKPIYEKHFFDKANGRPPASATEAADFAKDLDQVATSRLSGDAYGRTHADLTAATRRPMAPFSDPTQVGQAAAYKGHHAFREADELRAAGHLEKAEAIQADGMRQVTKQFDNQVMGRTRALQQHGVDVKPPPAQAPAGRGHPEGRADAGSPALGDRAESQGDRLHARAGRHRGRPAHRNAPEA